MSSYAEALREVSAAREEVSNGEHIRSSLALFFVSSSLCTSTY